jgi:hypothetical protein
MKKIKKENLGSETIKKSFRSMEKTTWSNSHFLYSMESFYGIMLWNHGSVVNRALGKHQEKRKYG